MSHDPVGRDPDENDSTTDVPEGQLSIFDELTADNGGAEERDRHGD